MKERPVFQLVSSPKLTTLLLCLSMALIFFGTLDQAQFGIRRVQALYFQSFVTVWDYPDSWYFGKYLGWLGIPIPGGYLIGPLMIVNLIAAHFRYFRMSLRNLGLFMIHAGILLLMLGQGVADLFQKDSYIWMDEGTSTEFSQSFHEDELVIVDLSLPDKYAVVSIPAEVLKKHRQISHPKLPFNLKVLAFYPNSVVRKIDPQSPQNSLLPIPTAGAGASMHLLPEPVSLTKQDDERNLPSAIVEIQTTGGSLGSWLLNTAFEGRIPDQSFIYEGHTYEIALRIRRNYLPFKLTLLDFEQKRYPGSEITREFNSWVKVTDSDSGEQREARIYMNHPLRYAGYTFYQASFGNQGTASMFQIVTNPGWLIPYLALTLVSFGLVFQFGRGLGLFLKRRFAA